MRPTPQPSASAPTENVRDRLPPVVAILSPSEGGGFSSSDLTSEYSVRSPSGLPVTVVRALIDGRPAEGAQTKGFVPVGTGDTKGTLQLIGVPSRNVNISVIAETGDLASVPATVALLWKGHRRRCARRTCARASCTRSWSASAATRIATSRV